MVDGEGASVLGTDIGTQSSGNYTYDAIGNLKSDDAEGITDIIWTVYGKIKEIKKNGTDELEFEYDASGNRVTKIVKPDASDASGWKYTYYLRDASGNVMATYNYTPTNDTDPEELKLQEHHIYGSSRIGIVNEGKLIDALFYEKQNFTTQLHGWYPTAPSDATLSNTIDNRMQVSTSVIFAGALYDVTTVPGKTYTVTLDIEPGASGTGLTVYDASYTTSFDNVNMPITGQYSIVFTATTTVSHIKLYSYLTSDLFYADNVEIAETGINPNEFVLYKGKRNFELTNHLGNVMSVVTDKKIAYLNSGNVSFEPNIISSNDYYPFGSAMPNRSFSSESYRYGFNGQEKIDEIYGNGNYLDFDFRGYNPRIGRFFAVDPLTPKYPWWTPYQFAGLMPIRYVDLEGLEPGEPFDSPLEAGKNFLEIYNEFSIQENREFSTTIYKYQDKDGKDQYSYNVPKRGIKAGSSPEFKADKEGAVPVLGSHTHGAFDEEFNSNEFSGGPKSDRTGDIEVSEYNKAPELLGTPQGSALIYDPKTKQPSAIKASIPSDPNDPDQVDSSTSVIHEATSKKQTRKDRRFFKQVNQDIRKIYKEEYKQKIKANKGG